MFNLTKAELDDAFHAIRHHGYSAMLPEPPEWAAIVANWVTIRDALEKIDLDTYEPYKLMRVYAPKNRANIRVVHLLHPQDLLIYTALVLIAKNDIELNRVALKAKRVFSYRTDISKQNILYEARNSYAKYRQQLRAKCTVASVKYVAVADIADFYPRIYQHRLENVIESVATTQRVRDVARVLVRKLIGNLMEKNSYGIPVGPYASRLLGEAILIDVDAMLQGAKSNFVRWVDDYSVFCKTEYEAQSILFTLGEFLFSKHGLTLQSAKTTIVPISDYRAKYLTEHEEHLSDRDAAIKALRELSAGYEESEEIDESKVEDVLAILHGLDLKGMLETSLADTTLVDYEAVVYALMKLPRILSASAELKREVLNLVIDNAELLYPVAEHITKYVLSFTDLTAQERKKIANSLLKPLKSKRNPPPPYYAMWVLHVFLSGSEWNHAKDIVAIYANTKSEVVRRYAALAVNTSGTRADVVSIKDDYVSASPLLKLAILVASRRLGADERKHWKQANVLNGVIDKLI
ncbi:MAG TPA: RNA-directed DNA polymerase [Candidatus Competibacteraceae bacterium]|nr:RNA-directed DNA polymerase [Candidatus Competibacteraceae bacterium]HRZ04689.1 RNA-directed DNA polymerase [Candidatus Competibacteraceae bacterium]HSA45034.1 RNA-directed DNA polymerase [Candidatus Competibacteraceae bacterium]